MGQKVNPNSFRFGITQKRNANWITDNKTFPKYVVEDARIRDFFTKLVREYLIGKVEISRTQANDITIHVHTAKVGAMLGQNGENLKKITLQLHKFIKNKTAKLNIQIVEVKNPSLSARLVAESIATQLERRGSYRSAQKQAIRSCLKAGAQGVKTQVSGRLNGVDMARTEGYTKGIMSLHTLRQKVEFATATANTTYGAIGIKVWISKGKILTKKGERNVTTKAN